MKKTVANPAVGAVAIIGMAGRFPGARDVAGFWRNLTAGVESVTFFADAELLAAGVAADLLALPDYVKARPILDEVEMFDAEFFGYSPREAELMDPQQRLFLETAWQALEQAGYDPDRFAGPIGVFGGIYLDTYMLANLLRDPAQIRDLLTGLAAGAYHTYLGNDKDYLTSRVAYKLNLRGPAVTVQTACSTSLVAVCQACQSLLAYQCDIALAGGATVIVPQIRGYIAQEGGMFSPDGHCRAFDVRAQGTSFGNGVGIVALKRLADALADGDQIYAVIKGSALNNDGAVKVSYTAPSVEGQAEVVALAQAIAGVSADTIHYLEAHGTGTPLGDPIEVEALTQAFRQTTDQTGFCALGSVKTNIGHLDAAAGVVGLIKTALALHHRLIPPTLHFEQPNPKIDFDHSPFQVVTKLTPWPTTNGTPRRAGVSSFGVGGTNAHVVLEEAPARVPAAPFPARPQLIVLSAKTLPALDQATANLAACSATQASDNAAAAALPDIAYTLAVGRREFPHRRIVVVRETAELGKLDPKRLVTGQAVRRDPPLIFMFPGQGAQQVGMGAELYEQEPVFREAFDRCAALLPGLDLRQAIADKARLLQTQVTQPALFSIEYALAQLWSSWGIRPSAMIGHSVGEYVAGCLAGVFTLADAVRLVAQRARLVQAQPPGAMTAVRLAEAELLPLLEPSLAIAAINAPSLCIVSGPLDAVAALEQRLKAAGQASVRLQTSHAFHSAMMEPVVAPFTELLRAVKLSPPQIPYVSNVTGRWVSEAEATDPHYWAAHVRQPVRFAAGVAQLFASPANILLEVGPGTTLSGLARQHPARPADQVVLSSGDDLASLLTARGRLWIAGVTLDRAADGAAGQYRRVALPTYPFQRKRCWVDPQTGPGTAPTAGAIPADASAERALLPAAADAVAPAQAGRPGPDHTEQSSTIADKLRALLGELSGKTFTAADDNSSFVELGFESLFLTQVTLAIARRFGVRVGFRELMGDLNTVTALAQHLAAATPAPPSPVTSSPPAALSVAPLTEAQREVWLATQLGDAASCAFNQSCVLHLRGALDREKLAQALAALVQRHDGLRLRFGPLGDVQTVTQRPTEPVLLPMTEAPLDELLATEAATPFDLEHGPVWRARLVRLAETHHVLLLSVHHIVCDGRSLALVAYELGELYSGRSLAAARSLLAYAASQQGGTADYRAAEKYWLATYAELPLPTELPVDYPRPAQPSFRGGLVQVALPASLVRALKQAGAQQGCTLVGTLLAAYFAFLQRLTGQEDLVVGVPTAAPGDEDGAPLVGHTVNFLALRSRVGRDTVWPAHLARTKQLAVEAFEHRQFTYGTLVQRLRLTRDRSRLPLVAASFNLAQTRHPLRFDGLAAATAPNPHGFTNQDLTFDFNQNDGGLELDCVYNAELLAPATVQRWAGQFVTLLEAIAAGTTAPVAALPLLTAAERRQLLVQWNDTAAEYPNCCVHELVAAQMARTPDRVAVVCGEQALSYRELNDRADQLAGWLVQQGVGPEKIVGINLERSLAMVVAMLAVHKAGGAYLPLDPLFPADRLEFMIADAQPVVVLTPALLEQAGTARALPGREPSRPVAAATPENLAYVLYTSGSTGKPKGVQITQRALVNFLASVQREPGLDAADVLLAVTTLSFDIAGLEIWLPLITGARLVLAERETVTDGAALIQLLAITRTTVLQATPATWRMMIQAGWAGTPGLKMLCGGEALPPDLAAALLERGAELWNLYGPTETTIWSAVSRVLPGQPIVLGRPLANTEFYVLDARFEPVPMGLAGELFIGGAGLARGYLHRPELTAEKFVAHPFGGPGARLYRTGDLVRARPDGTLIFLGRMDHQVKVRGYRIELGEIESVLRDQPGVADAVAIVREDVPGDKRIVAYLLPRQDRPLLTSTLRQQLRRQLPEYMVPTAFVVLESFPLTPNGKIDRRALPAPEGAAQTPAESYEPPRTALEEKLAAIWAGVLRMNRIGTRDDFFAVGGHSLLATQVMARMRDAFGIQVPLRSMFEHRTLGELAAHIEALLWAKQPHPAAATRDLVEGEL